MMWCGHEWEKVLLHNDKSGEWKATPPTTDSEVPTDYFRSKRYVTMQQKPIINSRSRILQIEWRNCTRYDKVV